MMKSDRKRGNSVVTVLLVLIFLILGAAGGVFLSRTTDLGFLDGIGGNGGLSDRRAVQSVSAEPVQGVSQAAPQPAALKTPEPAPAAEANTVAGDGSLTAQDGEDVLTPAAVTII